MHFISCRVFLLFLVSLYLSLSPLTMFDEKVTFFSIPLKHFQFLRGFFLFFVLFCLFVLAWLILALSPCSHVLYLWIFFPVNCTFNFLTSQQTFARSGLTFFHPGTFVCCCFLRPVSFFSRSKYFSCFSGSFFCPSLYRFACYFAESAMKGQGDWQLYF